MIVLYFDVSTLQCFFATLPINPSKPREMHSDTRVALQPMRSFVSSHMNQTHDYEQRQQNCHGSRVCVDRNDSKIPRSLQKYQKFWKSCACLKDYCSGENTEENKIGPSGKVHACVEKIGCNRKDRQGRWKDAPWWTSSGLMIRSTASRYGKFALPRMWRSQLAKTTATNDDPTHAYCNSQADSQDMQRMHAYEVVRMWIQLGWFLAKSSAINPIPRNVASASIAFEISLGPLGLTGSRHVVGNPQWSLNRCEYQSSTCHRRSRTASWGAWWSRR